MVADGNVPQAAGLLRTEEPAVIPTHKGPASSKSYHRAVPMEPATIPQWLANQRHLSICFVGMWWDYVVAERNPIPSHVCSLDTSPTGLELLPSFHICRCRYAHRVLTIDEIVQHEDQRTNTHQEAMYGHDDKKHWNHGTTARKQEEYRNVRCEYSCHSACTLMAVIVRLLGWLVPKSQWQSKSGDQAACHRQRIPKQEDGILETRGVC
mmetsp:Transcript_130063/g.328264  ORF Transcript_130063/g.328264 Transcript_130063/m.328264 type:complete len:209 (+) Transcript_130063:477-1103(+)